VSISEESPDYFGKTVNGISNLIKISIQEGDSAEILNALEAPLEYQYLIDGSDGEGSLTISDYERSDPAEDVPGKRKGLTALKGIDDISLIYAPNAYAISGLVGSLISHCENLRYRFAILDAPQGSSNVPGIDPRSDTPTDHAAFYYPWIKIINPETGMLQLMPPGGYVTGVYSRSDTERGVHKAPANEVVFGASDLEFQIMKGEQDVLNPKGVNVIRAFPGRGIRIWGARTLSSNTLWKYINVRRLFIYIEASIEKGTQWVVFEPNDYRLWSRVKITITQFLTGVWRSGALMGTTPEEAFFVKCDRSTMTQDDIDNGRLICIIGIAPVKPAEFVIFRIAQWQGGSAATE
jgi:phage tail sheath protein FI